MRRLGICAIIIAVTFSFTLAHADEVSPQADEDRSKGIKEITPYWRTLKSGGVVNEKYPGGEEGQARQLVKEGHKIEKKGKNFIVVDYERKLFELQPKGYPLLTKNPQGSILEEI